MQRVTFVRYTTKADHAEENERLSREVFAEVRDVAPARLAYALFRNGADFVHVFINMASEDSEVLTGLPSFKAFSKDSGERYATAPEVIRLELNLIESYGFR